MGVCVFLISDTIKDMINMHYKFVCFVLFKKKKFFNNYIIIPVALALGVEWLPTIILAYNMNNKN